MSFIKTIKRRAEYLFGNGDTSDGFDVIVIGAGHNGLVCAAYLAKAGRKVLVLEARDEAGGACQTGFIADEVRASRCAHLLRSLDPAVIKDLGLHRYGLKYADRAMPTVALDEDGAHIVLSQDPWASAETMRSHSEADAIRYPDFHKRIVAFAQVVHQWNGQVPGRLRGLFESGPRSTLSADALALENMGAHFAKLNGDDKAEFLRLAVSSVGDLLDRTFESDLVKGALAFDGVLGRAAGPFSPGTALGLVQQWSAEVAGSRPGMAQPEGGMGAVTDALCRSLEGRRGQIRFGAPVSQILVEGDQAIGVELVGGERIFAAQVVSGTDPKTTLLEMLGREHLETHHVTAMETISQTGVAAKLNLVLDRMPRITGIKPDEISPARFIIAPGLSYIEEAFHPSKYNQYSPRPIMEVIFPTLSDDTLGRQQNHVVSIIAQYAPYSVEGGWSGQRENFIQTCIDVLDGYMGGLADAIIGGELLTPLDLEEKFNLRGGHWHHGEMDLAHQSMLRPAPGLAQYLGPVKGLYLCSAGCHPGGGVSGIAGKLAAKRMLGDRVSALKVSDEAREGEEGEAGSEPRDEYGEAAQ